MAETMHDADAVLHCIHTYRVDFAPGMGFRGVHAFENWACPLDHDHDDVASAAVCVRLAALADHPRWVRLPGRWATKHPTSRAMRTPRRKRGRK